MILTLSYIALFAVLGAWARYGQTLLVQTLVGRSFPWATLSINVLGCFIMGFLFFETLERRSLSPELRTGILTGGLGAYTTFSTFSLETLVLFENGESMKGLLYMFSSLFLALRHFEWVRRYDCLVERSASR
ncbi:fluoride efflux transporter CrcB, partial [Acidithiobacillus caldus]|uniref:fluoride efflux transporter CrcB n=1 Tax=Acidithiobacillus caldus TaxID=33059 RepID=UPI001D026AF3|nr:fluoride efflux transporter CrcB [Acidithiobacillus caldus]